MQPWKGCLRLDPTKTNQVSILASLLFSFQFGLYHDVVEFIFLLRPVHTPVGGGALPINGLMAMCGWMGRIFTTGLTIVGSPFEAPLL